MVAFFNNCDEPTIDVAQADIDSRRKAIEAQIAAKTADLANQFPVPGEQLTWTTPAPIRVTSAGGATAKVLPDGSILFGGKPSERDTYTLVLNSDLTAVGALRLEVLHDPSLPHKGPGRADDGNFVLSKISVSIAESGTDESPEKSLTIADAQADFSQQGYPVAGAIDDDPQTGWAIDGKGGPGKQAALFRLAKPAGSAGARWTIRFEQDFGKSHLLGRFRVSLGQLPANRDDRPLAERRHDALEKSYNAWLAKETARAVKWTILKPTQFKANAATLHLLDDNSVLASGDQTKRDVYDLKYATDLRNITALRLEALPDDSLPNHGPGRIYYEGPFGSFFLSAMTVTASGQPVAMGGAVQTYAEKGSPATGAIDADPLSGWAIGGGQGRAQTALFTLAKPLENAGDLSLSMIFERYFSAPLGASAFR